MYSGLSCPSELRSCNVAIRNRMFLFQTPLAAQPGLGTQH